jgi:hypothetical protein
VSYELYIARGNPKHLAGRVEKLKPLDETIVRRALRAPPADLELHDGDGDEVIWAGEALIAQILLVRSGEGRLRSVETGVSSSGDGDYGAEFSAVATRLLELAESLRGHLYREAFDRSGRMTRDDIERVASSSRDRPPAPRADPPPRLLVDFYELSDDETTAYFAEHVARASDRLAAFRREVPALGGPSEAELDATPESLGRLGGWLFGALPGRYASLRGPTDDERAWGAGLVQLTPLEWRRLWPDEPQDLPPWCAPGAELAQSPLPPAALWLADGLGYYLGECVSRELGETRWEIYRAPSRRLRDVNENTPVLATARGRLNVHSLAYVVMLKALAYRTGEADSLRSVYEANLEHLRVD